jgi:hypothetical protein
MTGSRQQRAGIGYVRHAFGVIVCFSAPALAAASIFAGPQSFIHSCSFRWLPIEA